MAYTTIDDPSVYFHTQLFTGNGSTQSITNNANSGDFKPDWLWTKSRGSDHGHGVFDSNRGGNARLDASATQEERTNEGNVTFQTNGFNVTSSHPTTNNNSTNMVSWQWKANGGTATATGSESGNNPAYSTQANQTSGFSIITYTGTGATSSSVVPHGLGVTPEVVIVKRRDGTSNWTFESSKTHNARGMYLNFSDGSQGSGTDVMNKDSTNLSFVEIDNNRRVNHDGETYVAYCFAPIQGYSKIGSYVGNGSEPEGPFIYTGFKPAWFMVHASSESGQAWFIGDNKRDPHNMAVAKLAANTSSVESAAVGDNNWDFLSNGFKIRTQDDAMNKSGVTFLYMAFASSPLVGSDGTPCTAV